MFKYLFILLVGIALFLNAPAAMSKSYMCVVFGMACLSFLLFVKDGHDGIAQAMRKTYLRHSVFFIVCFFIVFFQYDIDYIVGLVDDSNETTWINNNVVCRAMALSNMALASLMVGYFNFKDEQKPLGSPEIQKIICCPHKQYLNLIILFLLSLAYASVPNDYLSYGYGKGLVGAGNFNLIIGYLQACFIAVFVLFSIDYRQRRSKKWLAYNLIPLCLIFLYIVLVIVTGRRTEVIKMVTLVFISYFYCNKDSVDYKKVLLLGVFFIGLLSVVGVARGMQVGDVEESFVILTHYKSIFPFTSEFASSVSTLHIALDNYPDKVDYNYGSTFLLSFLKIVPGLSYFTEHYILGHQIQSSADIFTDIFFTGDYLYGLGSSVVADVYISFGPIGVVVTFLVFGFFLRYLEFVTFLKQSSPYILALSFCCYSSFIYVCRGTLSNMFLCWIYACILILFFTRYRIKNQI